MLLLMTRNATTGCCSVDDERDGNEKKKRKRRRQKKCSTWRAAVIHHVYLGMFFPCSLPCFASHLLVALQEVLTIIFAVAVLRTSSLSQPSFISSAVILLVSPMSPIPFHMVANELLSWWYITDLDCQRAIRKAERRALKEARLGTVLRFEFLGGPAVDQQGGEIDDTASSATVQSVDSRTLARRKRRADAYTRRMERRSTILAGTMHGSTSAQEQHAYPDGGAFFQAQSQTGTAGRRNHDQKHAGGEEGDFGFEHGDFTLVSGANGMMSAFFTPATAGTTAARAAAAPSADDALWNPALWNAAGAYVEADGSVRQRLPTLNDAVIEILEDEQEVGGDVGDLFVDLATADDPNNPKARRPTPQQARGGGDRRRASSAMSGDGSTTSRRTPSTFEGGVRGRTIDVVQHTYHGRINLLLLGSCALLVILIFVANRGAQCDEGGPFGDFTFYCWASIVSDFLIVQPMYVLCLFGYRSLRAEDEVESADDQSSRPFAFLHPIPGRLRRVNIPDDGEADDVEHEEDSGVVMDEQHVGGLTLDYTVPNVHDASDDVPLGNMQEEAVLGSPPTGTNLNIDTADSDVPCTLNVSSSLSDMKLEDRKEGDHDDHTARLTGTTVDASDSNAEKTNDEPVAKRHREESVESPENRGAPLSLGSVIEPVCFTAPTNEVDGEA
jgi:hypothetical protein